MLFLASTRADDLAWEAEVTPGSFASGQGLLNLALLNRGLVEKNADYRPRDNSIGLGEWLAYSAGAVPDLYNQVVLNRFSQKGRLVRILSRDAYPLDPDQPAHPMQEPVFFDFRQRSPVSDPVISELTP